MNQNELARQLTLAEGLKRPMSIAQVKEVLNILISAMAEDDEILLMLARAALKRQRGRVKP
jgi:hypothetical protein